MKIIFALAGEGSRFRYYCRGQIKPLIEINNKFMFEYAVNSFPEKYKKIFVIQKQHSLGYNLKNIIQNKYPKNDILEVDPTKGQSESALYGISLLDDKEDFMIFNCDSSFDDNKFFDYFEELKNKKNIDGYIPYFIPKNETETHWSFIKFNQNNKVIDIKEKKQISKYATIGLYYFRNKILYENYYQKILKESNTELYVSKIYEKMIERNLDIYTNEIKNFSCFGTPEELEKFRKKING